MLPHKQIRLLLLVCIASYDGVGEAPSIEHHPVYGFILRLYEQHVVMLLDILREVNEEKPQVIDGHRTTTLRKQKAPIQ